MSEPERPTCATCAYYDPFTDSSGCCRRRPPVVFRDEKFGSTSFFPEVDADEWCGEHPDFPAFMATMTDGIPPAEARP